MCEHPFMNTFYIFFQKSICHVQFEPWGWGVDGGRFRASPRLALLTAVVLIKKSMYIYGLLGVVSMDAPSCPRTIPHYSYLRISAFFHTEVNHLTEQEFPSTRFAVK